MFEHILLTVDLEHDVSWKKSLPNAVESAQAFNATLHIMTVVPDFGGTLVSSFFPKDHKKQMMEAATNGLHAFVTKHVPKGIKVQHIVAYGTAYEEILHVAQEIDADLIIMGERAKKKRSKRKHVEDYMIGHNAARVVRYAKCSVLVVRDKE